MKAVSLGQPLPPDHPDLVFEDGWHLPQPGLRWTSHVEAGLWIALERPPGGCSLEVRLAGRVLGDQRVELFANGEPLLAGRYEGEVELSGVVDAATLADHGALYLTVHTPEAKQWMESHRRSLGFGLESLEVECLTRARN